MLFEFLVGVPPFSASTPSEIFDKILRRDILWPNSMLSEDARDLINKLLSTDPSNRLGSNGPEEVKEHPFFAGISWETILRDEAPFTPTLEGQTDSSFFEPRNELFKIDVKAEEDLAEDSGKAVNEDGEISSPHPSSPPIPPFLTRTSNQSCCG